MHWDPGPYWDWEHYFDLLGAPIAGDGDGSSSVVTVAPGFADNEQTVTGCDGDANTNDTCPAQGTNFVYLYSQPSFSAPFVTDPGLVAPGQTPVPSTTYVSDIGARAAAGQKLVVAEVQGDWAKVWWLGAEAWVYNPTTDPVLVSSQGRVATTAGTTEVPVYGRAYPEKAAYPAEIPYQTVAPLQYTIKPGQAFVLGDADIESDYYYAKTFRCKYVALDCTEVTGADRYYQIWFGHRIVYVRAADVTIQGG
jgi:hypothetical protein